MKLMWLAGVLACVSGCGDDDDISAQPRAVGGGNMPTKTQLEPGSSHSITTALDVHQCNMPSGLAIKEAAMQVGPAAARTDVSWPHGIYLAWSACNFSSTAASEPITYSLLAARDGMPAAAVATFLGVAIEPCQCKPEVVFVNVPAGSDSLVAALLPTQRVSGLAAGGYTFTLSEPFTDFTRATAVLP